MFSQKLFFIFLLLSITTILLAQKKAFFWQGNEYYGNNDGADSLINNRNFNTVGVDGWDISKINFFNNKGFDVVEILSHSTSLAASALTTYDPFIELSDYNTNKTSLTSILNNTSYNNSGICEDMEYPTFPRTEYTMLGNKYSKGWKNYFGGTIAYAGRINNSWSTRSSFKDYIGYTGTLTMDMIKHNFPVSCIADSGSITKGFMLGYYAPGFHGNYYRVAQTFIPKHLSVSKIKVRIKRFRAGADTTDLKRPVGGITYYITPTINGQPDQNIRLSQRYIKNYEFDYDSLDTDQDDFTMFEDMYLYIDSDELSKLDITKQYAFVLQYNSTDYSNWGMGEHYRVASCEHDSTGPYFKGKVYRGSDSNNWYGYPSEDLRFEIYYPDPPENGSTNTLQGISTNSGFLLGYNSTYGRAIQTFKVGTNSKISSVEVKIQKSASTVGGNILVSIQETNSGTPYLHPTYSNKDTTNTDTLLASYRINSEDLPTIENTVKIPLHCALTANKTYALWFEYEGSYSTTNYYKMRGRLETSIDPYTDGVFYKGDTTGWRYPYSNKDLYIKLYTTDFDLEEFHNTWVTYQTENLAAVINDYISISASSGKDVYLYSGFQTKKYFYETIMERYSMDWSLLNGSGLEYAICGYDATTDYISPTQTSLGSISLLGGVNNQSSLAQTESLFEDYYSSCSGGAMYYFNINSEKEFLIEPSLPKRGHKNIQNIIHNFNLVQNYPNPFNPTTNIEYSIKSRAFVSLTVYDILGRVVQSLVNEVKDPGEYQINFDASNLSSGTYFYTIRAGEFVNTKKLVLIK